MPHSMTGFASAEARRGALRLSWEIRSVNHRFLDLSFRMPDDLRALEPECRDLVGDVVKRGKLDCTLKVTTADRAVAPAALVDDALQGLRALESRVKAAFPHAAPLSTADVLRWPGVLEEPVQNLDELAAPIKECLSATVTALQDARGREGRRIAEFLDKRNKGITALIDGIRPLLDGMQARYRDRLRERVQRLDVQADPERLEQELALLAQRADVAEEIDRLGSHVTEVVGHPAAFRAGGSPPRFRDSGAEPRSQYVRVESPGGAAHARRRRAKGADRADARAGAESRVSGVAGQARR